MEYGVITLLPIAVLLIVAITTKKCISSIFAGIVTACILIGGTGALGVFIDQIYVTGCSDGTVWIVSLFAFIGAIICLMEESGGANALVGIVEKRVKSERSLFLWSWLLAAILFIEDIMRSAVIGQMTPLYDKFKIPRAKVAYFIDATSTTMTAIIPITGWAVFSQGIFAELEELKGYGSGLDIFMQTIPFNFYSILGVIICFIFTMGWLPNMGGMKKAYDRLEATGELYSEETRKLNPPQTQEELDNDPRPAGKRLFVFLAEIIVLSLGIIISGDTTVGFIIGTIFIVVMLAITKLSTWSKVMTSALTGVSRMVEMMVIVVAAYMFNDLLNTLGMPEYVIGITEAHMTASMLPFITFVTCAIMTFCCGSTWGLTPIFASVTIPLCIALGSNPFMVLAAIISGQCFGAHACFFCDYTVFASSMSKINNMEHAITQLPYALISGGLTAIAFLFTGLILI